MSVFREKMKDEYIRIMRIKGVKQEILDSLPKGSIITKQRNGHSYFYLSYRDGGRVVTRYISKDDVEDIREQLSLRKRLEHEIREADEDMKMIRKVVKV